MKKELENICIWGTSVNKVGDEAQLASILSFFKQHSPNIEVSILSRSTDKVLALLQQVGVHGDCIKLKDIIPVYKRLKKADALVIIGGPFFETWYQMLSIFILLTLAKLANTKVITFGATLFLLHTKFGKLFYRYVYSSLSIIGSRDDKANETLKANGVNRTAYPLLDPRYILQPAEKNHVAELLRAEGVDPAKPYVTITTRHLHDAMPDWVKADLGYSTEKSQESYAYLATVFSELAKKYQLVIVPMHPKLEEDFSTSEKLFAKSDSNCFILKKRYTPFEVMGIFQGSEFSVQSRLGSTVFSVVAGSPFFAISYESRMTDWMDANGLSEYCVDWRSVDVEEMVKKLTKLSESTDKIRTDFAALREEKSALFFNQADKILTDMA